MSTTSALRLLPGCMCYAKVKDTHLDSIIISLILKKVLVYVFGLCHLICCVAGIGHWDPVLYRRFHSPSVPAL